MNGVGNGLLNIHVNCIVLSTVLFIRLFAPLNSLVSSNYLWNDLRNDLVTGSFKGSRVLHRICMLLIHLLNSPRNDHVIAIQRQFTKYLTAYDSRVLESPIEQAIQGFTQPIELHGYPLNDLMNRL